MRGKSIGPIPCRHPRKSEKTPLHFSQISTFNNWVVFLEFESMLLSVVVVIRCLSTLNLSLRENRTYWHGSHTVTPFPGQSCGLILSHSSRLHTHLMAIQFVQRRRKNGTKSRILCGESAFHPKVLLRRVSVSLSL